jgi:hypothetical protein
MVTYPGGQFTQSGGWASCWTVAILPYIEQTAMASAYNFSAPAVVSGTLGHENTTVTYNQIATFLCPSEDFPIRPALTATTNYVGNFGGPGQIEGYSGVIVPVGDYSTINLAGPAVGRVGPVNFEGIRDGLTNTAMFAEHLHGQPGSPPVTPGPGSNAKRGIFSASGPGMKSGGFTAATTFVAACKSLPGATTSLNSDHLSNTAFATHPWYLSLVSYNHVGPPNSLNCLNATGDSATAASGYVGPSGSAPPTSNHPGGVQICMSDGSVRFVRDSVDQTIWMAIGTRFGKEIIDASGY